MKALKAFIKPFDNKEVWKKKFKLIFSSSSGIGAGRVKTYDYHIWQVTTSRGVDSNEIYQLRAGDVIMSRSHDKLKLWYLLYHNTYGHQIWQDGD